MLIVARLSMALALAAWAVALSASQAVTGTISTIAGDGSSGYHGDGGQAIAAGIDDPAKTVLDGAGNLYIADTGNSRIRRMNLSSGVITKVAGTFGGHDGDGGPATEARLFVPEGIALDGAGNLYIADTGNHCIRKVSLSSGIITTVAGYASIFGGTGGDGGPATLAELYYPTDVAVDAAGNLYIADSSNRIRKVTISSGIINTIAGTGAAGFLGDNGPAVSARLSGPRGVALDSASNVYIADEDNNRIRRISAATGVITTVAGGGSNYGENLLATVARLEKPRGIAVDGAGNLFIADALNGRIRKVSVSTGLITTVAGCGDSGFFGDNGAATAAALSIPHHVTVDAEGKLYISDEGNRRIRRVTAPATPALTIVTIAGNGLAGLQGDGGPATLARLSQPMGTAVDGAGNVYVADLDNHRIRRIDAASGTITTFAGTYEGFSGDEGPATSAHLDAPYGMAFDAAGNLYIADYFNDRVRRVSAATGIITTIAGTGEDGDAGDGGLATAAELDGPTGLAFDTAGNLYIADYNNHRIRRITTAGIISTVAGNGTLGFSGDGGAATSAQLRYPTGVAVDGDGNLYIADRENNRVRQVAAGSGIIATFAVGGGTYAEPQLAIHSRLDDPTTVVLDAMGNLYIAEYSGTHRIKKVTAATGMMTTVVGNGDIGFGGDGGVATAASLRYPFGISIDVHGTLYIADSENQRVRAAFASIPDVPPAFAATATSTSQIQLSWTPVAGASYFEIWRSANHAPFALVGTPAGTAATDPGRASNTTYLYQLRARRGVAASPFTNVELATTLMFQDTTLTASRIKAVHVTQLRSAVNAVRAAAGLAPASFPDATLTPGSTKINLVHLTSLRTALDEARAAIGVPAIPYAQPTLTAGSIVRATHLIELRNGTQ
ncbi:MAG TPA: hypothetical protein VFV49_07630 [Thermoanaerobaculia bacterium]|nr:hypothetical protein [Thermoanaerobaculia bacterium]